MSGQSHPCAARAARPAVKAKTDSPTRAPPLNMSGGAGTAAAVSAAPPPPPIHLKEYVVTDKLGSGSYGDVFKAYRKTGTRDVVAVKCVLRGRLSKFEADNLIQEIGLLKKLKHEFIVEMKDFAWDSSYIYIIMEYCGGGDLSRYLRTRRVLSEDLCKRFLQQLAAALQFLRSQNISHMDLKPQNILLSSRIGGRLKLADFGFAQHFSSDQTKSAIRGSPLYMAPEMIIDGKYDARVDLWSVGVILFECLFGRAPYKSNSVDELLLKIAEEAPIVVPDSAHISNDCRDLLQRCLQRDPAKRLDFDSFFAHPFLDLEHAPSEASLAKALSLADSAVRHDKADRLEEALADYSRALDYFVPIVRFEADNAKKLVLRKKSDAYIARAEEIKAALRPSSSAAAAAKASAQRQTSTGFVDNDGKVEELLCLCVGTATLKTAVEIAGAAERYEFEGQYQVALDKYEKGLGLLLPLLKSEPAGARKVALRREVARWMKRAEAVKEVLRIRHSVLSGSDDAADSNAADKACCVQ